MIHIVQDKTMFKILDGDVGFGSLSYTIEDNVFIIHSIFIQPLYRGNGYAEQLTLAARDFTQANALLLQPVCHYAVDYFQAHPIDNLV